MIVVANERPEVVDRVRQAIEDRILSQSRMAETFTADKMQELRLSIDMVLDSAASGCDASTISPPALLRGLERIAVRTGIEADLLDAVTDPILRAAFLVAVIVGVRCGFGDGRLAVGTPPSPPASEQ